MGLDCSYVPVAKRLQAMDSKISDLVREVKCTGPHPRYQVLWASLVARGKRASLCWSADGDTKFTYKPHCPLCKLAHAIWCRRITRSWSSK